MSLLQQREWRSFGENPFIWMGIALVVFGYATSGYHAHRQWPEPAESPRLTPWRRAMVLGGIALGLLTMALYAVKLAPQPVLVAGWLLAQVCFLGGFVVGGPRLHPPPARVAVESAVVALVLLAVLATRLWRNGEIPLEFHGDLASNALQARDILAGNVSDFFGAGYGGIPIIGFLPSALSIRFFGDTISGINTASAVACVLTLLAVYLLARELFVWPIAPFALLAGGADLVLLAWSRVSNFIDPVAFGTWAIYLIVRATRRNEMWAFALAGLLAGHATNMYYAGRITVPLIIALLMIWAFFSSGQPSWQRWHMTLTGVGIVLAMGPSIVYDVQNWDVFMARTRYVSIFSADAWAHTAAKYHLHSSDSLSIMWTQFDHSLLFFWRYPDASTQAFVNRHLLEPVTGIIFILGLGYAIAHVWNPAIVSLLAWVGAYLLVSTFSLDPPGSHKMIGMVVPVLIVIAIGLSAALSTLFPAKHLGLVRIASGATILIVSFTMNWQHYVAHASRPSDVSVYVQIGRYLEAVPGRYRIILVSDSVTWDRRELKYFARGREGKDVSQQQLHHELQQVGASPTAFILTRDAFAAKRWILGAFPGSPVRDGSLRPLADVFHVVLVN